jgi:hypothetical protein
MTILRFVSQDELDDLPEDHAMAFMTLVNHAQRRFAEQANQFDSEERNDWYKLEELRHSFMNVIVAAAKRFEIEPFVSMQVPRLDNFQERDHRQFMADVDHFVTQLMLDNSIRARSDSVEILPKSRDRIRSYVNGLRQCLEQANMSEAKREALLKRLDAFEHELERRRISILTVTRVVLEILAVPGGLWASADVATRLGTNIMQVVAEMKKAEDETRQLAPVAPPKKLSPPRIETPAPTSSAFDTALDDDVPF